MSVILAIVLGFLLLYALLMVILSLGLTLSPPPIFRKPGHYPPVTVIVPFRNESGHLPSLVRDLSAQSYPDDLLEVIFVNDHSEDGSEVLLREQIKEHGRFRCVDLPAGIVGKKPALVQGMQHASGEWIIQTDADCRLGRYFVETHISCRLETTADLVAGMVTTGERKNGLLRVLERLDLLSLTGAGAGSFQLGRPLMCSGANLAYTRSLFDETQVYQPKGGVASGDDMFVMIGARKLGKKLVYLTSRKAIVKTRPADNLRSLLKQRIRWGSKTVFYRQPDIQGVALLTAVSNLAVLGMPLMILLDPVIWQWLVPAFLLKTLAEFTLLYITTDYTGQQRDLRLFLPALLLYYPYQGAILAGMIFLKVRWKGRNS
jgi:cellulose synthase/poly-beta-1,6-N-acetylglucosamine synthase-like glycosyltransferase